VRASAPETVAVLVAELMAFSRAFNIPVPDVQAATDAYVDGLRNLPEDLLVEAVHHARTTWKWGMRMPTPAEVREPVAEEFERRNRELTRARLALRKLPKEAPKAEPPVDPERAAAEFARARAILASVEPVKIVPKAKDDDAPELSAKDRIRRGMELLAGRQAIPHDPIP